ncbi:cytochrome protein [Aspergillus heteromorphus CBS 117.55]|uniref:Cytochrome protein n=1 Tax=Aspergillus heteromorphus CBS 117.55 TaxID=1448321 RepID=A0A317WI19_9EURO|nr:cytochrome protein [Aspergillus heteromorphus CBS 117.55]PWY85939.1 cytochrome protein [Aspergillus heteromorphus CBS 117.55]
MLFQLLLGLVGLYLVRIFLARKKSNLPLPPGPKPKPFVGNLDEMPAQGVPQWRHWLRHKELYGPISSITVFGQPIIILNEARLATEILDKRSAIYSARPEQPFMAMTGWDKTMATVENTHHYAKMRKALHQEIGTKRAFSRFDRMMEVEISRFLLRLLESPEEFRGHLKRESFSFILKMTYGYNVEPEGSDPFVDLAEKGVDQICQAMLPGTWLVDYVPILRYLPPWFPGAGFVRIAKEYRKHAAAFLDIPYMFVRQRMAQGDCTSSYMSNQLRESKPEPGSEEETVLKWSGVEFYLGGSDTVRLSTILSFFLAMSLNPEVQRKAQDEIDRVVGTSRLPGHEDRDSLPYINALVKEALRWHPALPTASPHMLIKDDTYKGYYFPKGSVFLPNIWAYAHDPDVYPNPMEFRPERFLSIDGSTPETDPSTFVFGFGRRACPGQVMTDFKVYLTIVRILVGFNITPKTGHATVDLENAFIPAILSHPKPFDVKITPRSPAHERLIRTAGANAPWERSHAEEFKRAMRSHSQMMATAEG